MTDVLELSTDVLVIGGGPAGAWAALRAAKAGADVVLVDKATAERAAQRPPPEQVFGTSNRIRLPVSGRRPVVRRSADILQTTIGWTAFSSRPTPTWISSRWRADIRSPIDPSTGKQIRTGLQGPEYMRRMRTWIRRAGGVRILDHSPALELLVDCEGRVRGVAGYQRHEHQDYRVSAGAVVVASGGCAFLSGALGTNVDTGDGALMAAEVGAEFSGMEFSNAYGIAAAGSTITKTAYYAYATFFHADGRVLEGAGSAKGRSVIASTLRNEPVFAQIDRADAEVQRRMRLGQPNFFLQFDRRGIDPFTDKFEVGMLAEGTVRGTGGNQRRRRRLRVIRSRSVCRRGRSDPRANLRRVYRRGKSQRRVGDVLWFMGGNRCCALCAVGRTRGLPVVYAEPEPSDCVIRYEPGLLPTMW